MKSVSKEDHPDLVGGVVWSSLELDWIRARDAEWESIVAEQRGTIHALNIALGGEGSTSTENLIDAGDIDNSDAGLIALCRNAQAIITKKDAEIERLNCEGSACDMVAELQQDLQTTADALGDAYRDIASLMQERDKAKSTVGNRCVEIEELRAEVERLTKERDDLSAERQTYINLAHAAGQANMHMSTEVDRLTKLNSTMAAATVGLRAELAAAQKDSFSTKCKLVQIHDALSSMSDTDPMLDDDMTDDEVREYEPVFWAAKEVAGLIGDSPWDRYTRAAMSEEKEAQP